MLDPRQTFIRKYIGLPGVRVEKGGALLTQVLLPHTQPKPWKKVNAGVKPVFFKSPGNETETKGIL
jgi:hypothetical protein